MEHSVEPGASTQEAETPASAPREAGLPLSALVESLLFVADEAVSLARLVQALDASEEQVNAALTELDTLYRDAGGRGIRLQRKGDKHQLVTAPAAAPIIERFLGLDLSTKLSNAAMETLAVIAYRQPITRAEIEAVRGVSCDGVLRTLLARGLVEPGERLEQAGRPFVYNTTFQFLQYFGLETLETLPPLPAAEEP